MYIVDPIKCYLPGGVAVVGGIVSHSKKKQRLRTWIPTTGSVHNLRRDRDEETIVYVRFSDQNGQDRTAGMKVADGNRVGLGTKLDICYNPKNPEEAFVRAAQDVNLSLYIPLLAGILLLAMGVVSQITLSKAGLR